MAASSQRGKLILALAVLAIGIGWMWHTWKQFQPIRRDEPVAQRREQADRLREERPQAQSDQTDLTPEQRIARQHRTLYRRLQLTDSQRAEARVIERQHLARENYREREFRMDLRAILTAAQQTALDTWLTERQASRETRPANS